MSDSPVLSQLADLAAAIDALPVRSARDAAGIETLEEVKRGLDDARLRLWSRLQEVHSGNPRAFEERFRARRATELCTRLATDLKLGVIDPSHPEFADLWIAAMDLGKAIQAVRQDQAPGSPS